MKKSFTGIVMKKSFTGPVWLLIIFGVLQSVYAYWGIVSVLRLSEFGRRQDKVLFVITILIFPLAIFGEALIYLLIRRRNRARLLSWTHAAIFCFAFLVNTGIYLLAILHEPIVEGMTTGRGRIMLEALFWGLVIGSHAAFVQVLISAFRKEMPLTKRDGEPQNLLDDVVL